MAGRGQSSTARWEKAMSYKTQRSGGESYNGVVLPGATAFLSIRPRNRWPACMPRWPRDWLGRGGHDGPQAVEHRWRARD